MTAPSQGASALHATFRRARLVRWGVALFVVLWGLYAYRMSAPGIMDREEGLAKGGDFQHFYTLGMLAIERRGDALYDARAQYALTREVVSPQVRYPFPRPGYGPQVALAFAPLAWMPFERALAAFVALTIAVYIGSAIWLLRVHPDIEDRRVVLLLACAAPALWYLVRYGQTSAIALGFIVSALGALVNGRRLAAGVAIGGLFYKPQLGILLAPVLLASREWGIMGGALASIGLQLAVGWAWFGTAVLQTYARAAWGLVVDRAGTEPAPHHLHSIRGQLSLLLNGGALETWLYLAALGVCAWLAYRSWNAPGPLPVRYAQLVLLGVLASPHLNVYDLVVLMPVFFAVVEHLARRPDDRGSGLVAGSLAVLYLVPVVGTVVAYFTRVQMSVPAMCVLAWQLHRLSMRAAAPSTRLAFQE